MHLPIIVLLVMFAPQTASPPATVDDETCLACHREDGLSLQTGDGASVSLRVDADQPVGVGARETRLRGLPHRHERSAASGTDVRERAGPQAGARRTVPPVPLRELYEDARQRAPAGGRTRRSHGAGLRGLPRVARRQARRGAARRRLPHLRDVPRGDRDGVRAQRARPRADAGKQRRAGLHRLPPRA